MNHFKQLGVMVDCSRNGVLTVQTLKRFIDLISQFGYNQLMLYTEDVYEIDGEPYFGYMRGRYSHKELKEVDAYALQRGVELVPCIQTLAHLNQLFRHGVYAPLHDIDNCFMLEDEGTYQLIDKMIKTCSECFTSKRIHVGMDEANHVGFGRYFFAHGYKTKAELILGHAKKVCAIAEDYGFEEIKVWYDQFAWSTFGDDFYNHPKERNCEFADHLPEKLKLVYWDYADWYFPKEERYACHMEQFKQIKGDLGFAGFAYKWSGLLPDNAKSIEEARKSVDACVKNQIDDYLVTSWGDSGTEASIFSVLPSLYTIARFAHGEENDKAEFERIVGVKYDDFMLLDKPNNPGNAEHLLRQITPTLLYNDVFQNVADGLVYDGLNQFYAECADELSKVNGGTFQYVFDSIIALCEILSVKAELGKTIRKAYTERDRDGLLHAVEEIRLVTERINAYEKQFRTQWYAENKSFGYQCISVRVGALKERLRYCAECIDAYLNGTLATIEELEETVLYECRDINGGVAGFYGAMGYGYY